MFAFWLRKIEVQNYKNSLEIMKSVLKLLFEYGFGRDRKSTRLNSSH